MGKSSKDKRDVYYRLAKEKGYRARSAFKLLHINEEFDLFKASTNVTIIDKRALMADFKIDRYNGKYQPEFTAKEITSHFEGSYADLVVCDGAPDVTGLHDLDEYIQSHLLLAALNITTHVLSTGGTFVAKIFRGKDVNLLFHQLSLFFSSVYCVKPRSSRNSSIESFVVCVNYNPPTGYIPSMDNPLLQTNAFNLSSLPEVNKSVVPFIACGDLSQFDSDMTYPLEEDCCLPPVQAPINPPYKMACTMKHGDITSAMNRLGLEDRDDSCTITDKSHEL
uniref:Ribosomal RNA methyltransferase FtsJ domain-containing protein n=1 Tax=Amphimedon queenslandica TaxID=400682 RepID=A0A1X7UTB4_AMPQE